MSEGVNLGAHTLQTIHIFIYRVRLLAIRMTLRFCNIFAPSAVKCSPPYSASTVVVPIKAAVVLILYEYPFQISHACSMPIGNVCEVEDHQLLTQLRRRLGEDMIFASAWWAAE